MNISARIRRFSSIMLIALSSAWSFSWSVLAAEVEQTPYIFVLGVVQDAGYPQSGCYLPHCMPGWEDPALRRGATCISLIDPAAKQKWLFEATPNFPDQLYRLHEEAPDDEFSLSGIFLTHAHIGHYAGLMFLGHESMGASGVPVYAMPRMHEYLKENGPWSQLVNYKNIELRALENNKAVTTASSEVTPFLVPHRDEYSETVGYRLSGPNKSALFIPDINKWADWDQDIAELVKGVDYALLDAAFFDHGELPGRDMSKIPHPFVKETMDALQELTQAEKNKVWFIHMNHTNPLLKFDSPEAAEVRAAGYNIATEGTRLPM
ncbi:MAG: MBL fold metallo-hydrolase [Pseudomonadota bacterium]